MGYIKLERKLFESSLWTSEPFTRGQAWVDLIAMANFADRDRFYKGTVQHVERGQVVTSTRTLAERWGWSKKKVSGFLRALERAQMVTRDGTTKWTTLTLVNYGLYQDKGTTQEPQNGTRRNRRGTNEEPMRNLQEEMIIKEKNDNGGTKPPTRAEVSAYIEEKGLQVDPDRFVDYYESVGWEVNGKPMRSWKAACRRWSGTEDFDRKQSQPKSYDELMEEARKLTPEDLYGPTWNGGTTA